MTLDEFKALSDVSELDQALQALWQDWNGNWDQAHDLAQAPNNAQGDWVHAYLHRKEGDIGNAGYWYSRASQPRVSAGVLLEEEWDQIATTLLASGD
tara:strand:- start:208 stop:498 length:291 start_codon:yes stop_codon:yes gene_type:complete